MAGTRHRATPPGGALTMSWRVAICSTRSEWRTVTPETAAPGTATAVSEVPVSSRPPPATNASAMASISWPIPRRGNQKPSGAAWSSMRRKRPGSGNPRERDAVDLLKVVAHLGVDDVGTKARVQHRARRLPRPRVRERTRGPPQGGSRHALVQVPPRADPPVAERGDRARDPHQIVAEEVRQPGPAGVVGDKRDVPAEVVSQCAGPSRDAEPADTRALVHKRDPCAVADAVQRGAEAGRAGAEDDEVGPSAMRCSGAGDMAASSRAARGSASGSGRRRTGLGYPRLR